MSKCKFSPERSTAVGRKLNMMAVTFQEGSTMIYHSRVPWLWKSVFLSTWPPVSGIVLRKGLSELHIPKYDRSLFRCVRKHCERPLLAYLCLPDYPPFCLSVCPHGKTRLPLDGFSSNLIFEYFFRKSVGQIQVSLKSDKNNGYFTWRLCLCVAFNNYPKAQKLLYIAAIFISCNQYWSYLLSSSYSEKCNKELKHVSCTITFFK